jgi:hypothetical protein
MTSLSEFGSAGCKEPQQSLPGLPKCMYLSCAASQLGWKTGIWRGVQDMRRGGTGIPVRFKYQSYWYGNAPALTIYVNADELHSSPTISAAVCAVPA